jgi:hypothetical protein
MIKGPLSTLTQQTCGCSPCSVDERGRQFNISSTVHESRITILLRVTSSTYLPEALVLLLYQSRVHS